MPTAEPGECVILRPQPLRPAMRSNRTPSPVADQLRAVHRAAVAEELSVDAMAQRILHHLLSAAPGSPLDAATLYRRTCVPRDCRALALDAELERALFADGTIDRWAESIRRQHAGLLEAGADAYARAVMQTAFAGTEAGQSLLPPVLERLCVRLDRLMLETALDVGLDLSGLENLCGQLCVRFLCNTVLLPRLMPDAAALAGPAPSAAELEHALARAFDAGSLGARQRWMGGNERALNPVRAGKLQRLFREADLQDWFDDHRDGVNALGRLRPEFFTVARTCLTARFRDESFVLLCLLRIYQSYPMSMEYDVGQRKLKLASEGGDSPQERAELARKQTMLKEQRERWMADVQFIRRHLSDIDGLSGAGAQYLMQKLVQLAQAEHRPRVGALDLAKVLERAMRQQDVIFEEEEADQ